MASPTFSEPFTISQKSTIKTSVYADFRKEVGHAFTISLPEVNFLLPKKATAFELKLSNGLTAYSIDSSPILFFRRDLSDAAPSAGSNPPQKNSKAAAKGKKDSNSNSTLIPTIFALWRVPSLLPPVYTFDDVYDKIATPKPTELFTPGVICPDLPDQFLLQATTHPSNFLNLLPNQLHNQSIPEMDQEEDPLNQTPDSTPYFQQSTYPLFHHNKSFDFVLRPNQLRAVYIKNSPYCIGIGIVSKTYQIPSTFTNALTAQQKQSTGYLTPWTEANNLGKDELETFFAKVEKSENDELIEKMATQLTKWPRSEGNFNADAVIGENGAKIVQLDKAVVSSPQSTFTSTLSAIQAVNNVSNSLCNTQTPMSVLLNFLQTPQSLATLFPSTSLSSPDLLQSTMIPTIAQSATNTHPADLSVLTAVTSIQDRRPLPSGQSLTILHSMNDSLADTYRTFYPTDGFEWIDTKKASIKPYTKFATLSRTINLLFRLAWLSCCCKPLTVIASESAPKNGADGPEGANKYIIAAAKLALFAHGHDLPRGDAAGAGQDDCDDEDGYYDEDDEDWEFEEDDGEALEDDTVDAAPQQGICSECYSARLEWALQYAVASLIPEWPCQFSEVPKLLRACSYAPSCLHHIHSYMFASAVHSQQKGNKPMVPKVFCTCVPCSKTQQNTSDPTTLDFADIAAHCRCVNAIPLDLMMNAENNSKYSKMATLIKYAEKCNWVKTKLIKQQQVLASAGICQIDIKGPDKVAIRNKLDNPNAAAPSPSTTSSQQQHQPTATVQVIQAVKFKPSLRQLLETVPSYMRFAKHIAGKQPSNAFTPLEVISYYANVLHELNQGNHAYILAAVREYVNSNDLTVVVRGNEILKNNVKDESLLPPAVISLLVKAKGGGKGNYSNNNNNNHHTNNNNKPFEAYTGPKTVVAGGKTASTTTAPPKSGKDNKGSDFSGPETNHSDNDDDDLDDLLNAGGNSSRTPQQIKQEQTKLKKQAQQLKQQQNKAAQTQGQNKQQPARGRGGTGNGNGNGNDSKAQTVVHLIRDPMLYKALNLPDRWFTMPELENLVTKELTSTKSLCTADLFTVHQLYINRELVEYLFDIHANPDNQSKYQPSQLPAASTGLQLIKEAKFGQIIQNGVDIPRLFTLSTSKLSFKGTSGDKGVQASSSQPAILVFSKTYRNKDLTLVIGFELFGLSPKDVVKADGFSTYMACANKLLDTKEDSDLRRLFPTSINEKCQYMLKLQGNQVQKFTAYCIDTLKIHPSNIIDVSVKKKNK